MTKSASEPTSINSQGYRGRGAVRARTLIGEHTYASGQRLEFVHCETEHFNIPGAVASCLEIVSITHGRTRTITINGRATDALRLALRVYEARTRACLRTATVPVSAPTTDDDGSDV